MLVLLLVLVPALVASCAHSKSAAPVDAGALSDGSASVEASAPDAATTPDASAFCGCAGQTCCAERDPASGALVTRCLPNCITNTPRWKVCTADSDCESGHCKTYDCGPGAPPLEYCDKPDGCQ